MVSSDTEFLLHVETSFEPAERPRTYFPHGCREMPTGCRGLDRAICGLGGRFAGRLFRQCYPGLGKVNVYQRFRGRGHGQRSAPVAGRPFLAADVSLPHVTSPAKTCEANDLASSQPDQPLK